MALVAKERQNLARGGLEHDEGKMVILGQRLEAIAMDWIVMREEATC